jgi:hypothetical protein
MLKACLDESKELEVTTINPKMHNLLLKTKHAPAVQMPTVQITAYTYACHVRRWNLLTQFLECKKQNDLPII